MLVIERPDRNQPGRQRRGHGADVGERLFGMFTDNDGMAGSIG